MPRGAAKTYDPKPGELFCGVLVIDCDPHMSKPGVRWATVQCRTCKQTRRTNLYKLTRGGASGQCKPCALRASLRARRAA